MPLTSANEGIVGEPELRALRPTAYVLNPARGPLIQEQALLRALREGWIAGAALDTHYRYPMPPEHPLWKIAERHHDAAHLRLQRQPFLPAAGVGHLRAERRAAPAGTAAAERTTCFGTGRLRQKGMTIAKGKRRQCPRTLKRTKAGKKTKEYP